MDPTGFIVIALDFLPEEGNLGDSDWRELGRAIWTLTGGWLPGFLLFKNWSRQLGRTDDAITTAWQDFALPENALPDRQDAVDVFERFGAMDFAFWPAVQQSLFVSGDTGAAKGLEDLFGCSDAEQDESASSDSSSTGTDRDAGPPNAA